MWAGGLRLGDSIRKLRIAESNVMLECVVAGMVDTTLIAFAAVFDVERGDPEVLHEGREVRSRAERLDGKVGAPMRRSAHLSLASPRGALVIAVDQHPRPQPCGHADPGFRIFYP